jgi:hypothetical protein
MSFFRTLVTSCIPCWTVIPIMGQFKIDTGADLSVVPEYVFKKSDVKNVDTVQEQYSELFSGLGKTDWEYIIKLKNHTPRFLRQCFWIYIRTHNVLFSNTCDKLHPLLDSYSYYGLVIFHICCIYRWVALDLRKSYIVSSSK